MTPPEATPAVDRAAIETAALRIAPWVRRTPVMRMADRGRQAELKLEVLQLGGTFKARGAFNRLLANPAGLANGVAAASGGNHGIAVATACLALKVSADIFVPGVTPGAKRRVLEKLGATVHVVGTYYAEAAEACEAFVTERGALTCHAYDQFDTVAGQGTLAREWLAQTQGVDTLLVAVGGGGLIGGIAAWCRNDVRIIAVESTGCPTLHESLIAGARVRIDVSGSAADSLGARQVGEIMFPLAQAYVHDSILVDDPAIARAQHHAWDSLRLALEPGGAAALAAWLEGVYEPAPDERVGVLLCGSNMGPPAALALDAVPA